MAKLVEKSLGFLSREQSLRHIAALASHDYSVYTHNVHVFVFATAILQAMVFRPGQFYGFAALIGCLTYPLLRQQLLLPALVAALVTILVTFALRVLAITRNWRTAPVGEGGLLFPARRQRPIA